jgi:transcriptional regulator with XRE-family HTH domain
VAHQLLLRATMPERMELAEPNPADTFGARLRYQRERRKISIATIAEATKILGALIEGLERDDVSRWPTGLYRRAFLRAYASAIGLDPEATLREFLVRFPEPEAMVLVSSPTVPRAAAAPVSTMSYRSRCIAAGVDWFVLSVIGLTLYLVLGSFWAPVCVAAAMASSCWATRRECGWSPKHARRVRKRRILLRAWGPRLSRTLRSPELRTGGPLSSWPCEKDSCPCWALSFRLSAAARWAATRIPRMRVEKADRRTLTLC